MPTAETARTDLRKLSDKVDDALGDYVFTNGRDSRHQADEYRDEGYQLGAEAYAQPEEDREYWIEAGAHAYPKDARFLVAVAADYRLAEMIADEFRFRADAA